MAVLLRDRFSEDFETLKLPLEKAGFEDLSDLISHPYRYSYRNGMRVKNERPTDWE